MILGATLYEKFTNLGLALKYAYPDCDWEHSLFVSRGKKATQRLLKVRIQELMPGTEIVEDYKHPDLVWGRIFYCYCAELQEILTVAWSWIFGFLNIALPSNFMVSFSISFFFFVYQFIDTQAAIITTTWIRLMGQMARRVFTAKEISRKFRFVSFVKFHWSLFPTGT